MAILKVIAGGGKPTPIRTAKKRSMLDRCTDELYKVLPAPSRAEIAERLEKRLQIPISISFVDQLLHWVRANCDTLRWTVFYAARGPNRTGADRYIVVELDRGRGILTEEEQLACFDGSVSTLMTLQTTARHFHAMLLAEAGQISGRKKPRMLRSLAADLDYFASKVDNMVEELEETNGVA